MAAVNHPASSQSDRATAARDRRPGDARSRPRPRLSRPTRWPKWVGCGRRRPPATDAPAIFATCSGARSTTTTRAISISCRLPRRLPDGDVKMLVAIADVDAVVVKGSPVDRHAAVNTTSVYTPAAIFPMLPERLSTDLTSLADQQDRLAIVIEFVVSADGIAEDVRRLRRDGSKSGEAGLQRRRRVAGRERAAAGACRRGSRHGRAAQGAGPGRAGARPSQTRARCARLRDARRADRVRRRRGPRGCGPSRRTARRRSSRT